MQTHHCETPAHTHKHRIAENIPISQLIASHVITGSTLHASRQQTQISRGPPRHLHRVAAGEEGGGLPSFPREKTAARTAFTRQDVPPRSPRPCPAKPPRSRERIRHVSKKPPGGAPLSRRRRLRTTFPRSARVPLTA